MKSSETEEWVDWLTAKVLQKAVVTDKAGNILVLKRNETRLGQRQGKWDLPGGSMGFEDLQTDGQPHEGGLGREIKDETGLKVEKIIPVCVCSGKKLTKTAGEVLIYAVGFQCKVGSVKPEVILSHEHTEYNWVSLGEIGDIDFGEDESGFHRQTIKAYLDNQPKNLSENVDSIYFHD